VIEADHGKLKILIKPVRGFKSIPTAYATIKRVGRDSYEILENRF
jgi:hypothetical protein